MPATEETAASANQSHSPRAYRVGVVAGSTRPGANSVAMTAWVHSLVSDHQNFEYEVISLAEWKLPLFDEPVVPAHGGPSLEHTKAWSRRISGLDGFIFVSSQVSISCARTVRRDRICVVARTRKNAIFDICSFSVSQASDRVALLRLCLGCNSGCSSACMPTTQGLAWALWSWTSGLQGSTCKASTANLKGGVLPRGLGLMPKSDPVLLFSD